MFCQPIFGGVIQFYCSTGNVNDRIGFTQCAHNSCDRLYERVLSNEKGVKKTFPVLGSFFNKMHSMTAICKRAIQIHKYAIV